MKEGSENPSGAKARALLDDLDRTELSLQHQKSLLRFLEGAGDKSPAGDGGASRTSQSPVRSPEEAEAERHQEEALAQLASDGVGPVRQQVADLEGHRKEIFVAMAEGGCFEGRWVGNGDRAVYLQRAETHASEEGREDREPQFELLEGPWAWVEGAPEGEDPRETLARGEILDHRMNARNQLCIIFGVPAAVVVLGYPLIPAALLLIVVVATLAVLLHHLPRGYRRILDQILSGPEAERREARELAAVAQLINFRRGVTDAPTLDELEKEFSNKLAHKRGKSIYFFRGAHRLPDKTEPDDACGEGGTREESQEPPVASGIALGGMTRAAVLLSLAGGEKNLGELMAHIRAFSGTAFEPGPAELGECLRNLGNKGLVRQTGGKPPFARYKITPDGGRELHARTASELDVGVVKEA